MTRAPTHRTAPLRAEGPHGTGAVGSPTIVIVDDEADERRALRSLLQREGHRVLAAGSGAKVLGLLADESAQVLVINHEMPVMSGELLLRAVRERDPVVQIVLLTGRAAQRPARETLRRLDVLGYHERSDGPERLLVWIDLALVTHQRVTRLRALEERQRESRDAARATSPAAAAPSAFAERLHGTLLPLLVARLELTGNRLQLNVAPDLPVLDGDAARLGEALANLLAGDPATVNPGRCVAVDVRCEDADVAIAVADHGGGDLSGLGVAMARCIVSADFGGTLVYEPASSGGMSFTIRLPIPGVPRPEPAAAEVTEPARDNVAALPSPRESAPPPPEEGLRAAGGRRA